MDCCSAVLVSGSQLVLDFQSVYNYGIGQAALDYENLEDNNNNEYSLFEIPDSGVFKYTQTVDRDEAVIIPGPLQKPLAALVSTVLSIFASLTMVECIKHSNI